MLAELVRERAELITSSYALSEAVAIAQARHGFGPVEQLQELYARLQVVWIDAAVHERAMRALLDSRRRLVSLTDWTSFALMRDRGIQRAFAFDGDFADQGFELIPAAA